MTEIWWCFEIIELFNEKQVESHKSIRELQTKLQQEEWQQRTRITELLVFTFDFCWLLVSLLQFKDILIRNNPQQLCCM